LESHQLPHKVFVVDELPVTSAGKPDRKAAAQLFGNMPDNERF